MDGKEVNNMSVESRSYVPQAQYEGLRVASQKVARGWVEVRREVHPKKVYRINQRISFGSSWRK